MNPKGLTDRIVEFIIALVIFGFVMQMIVASVTPLIPYALGGLAVVGVGAWFIRRKSQW